MVLEPGDAGESQPELRKLASDRARVASERVDGRDAVDKHRQNERGQIGREVSKESDLRGIDQEGEEDGGREKNGGVEADVVRLVLAEDLVRCLRVF